jgi:hypothetical protein
VALDLIQQEHKQIQDQQQDHKTIQDLRLLRDHKLTLVQQAVQQAVQPLDLHLAVAVVDLREVLVEAQDLAVEEAAADLTNFSITHFL